MTSTRPSSPAPSAAIAKRRLAILVLLLSVAGIVLAQRSRSRFSGGERTAREVGQHSTETPTWTNAPGFQKDVWTFVRLRYHDGGYRFRGGGGWATDFPDADLNISWRVQQMTSMKVDPDARVLDLTDPELYRFPFIYIVEPGGLMFTDEEVPILRRYLLNGGFLMFDDFWGEYQWANVENEMKKVFPERNWIDLPRTHPIFHCVFNLPDELNLQCPSIHIGSQSGSTGITWEYHNGEECKPMHVRAIHDDHGRIMVIATHNTDNGDGWEREGENEYYFREFSEKKSYPLSINIFFYAMTH